MPSMTERETAPQFFPVLESLRGIAALIVVLYHVTWRTHFSHWGLVRNGYLMVDFFFVLSGFVIFHAYGDRIAKVSDLWRFLVSRFFRLYPLHLATLLCFLLIEIAKWTVVRFQVAQIASAPFSTNNAGSFFANLLMLQGFGFSGEPAWNVPSWSISVEFWIYILFAWLVLAAHRFDGRFAQGALQAGATMLLLVGLLTTYQIVHGLTAVGHFAFFRGLLGFFSGVWMRWLYAVLRVRRFDPKLLSFALSAAGLIALAFLFMKQSGPSDLLCIPLFSAIVLIAALGGNNAPRLLRNPHLLAIGTISYSIYMVHAALAWCFEFALQYVARLPREQFYSTGPWVGDLLALVFVALVIATAHITFRYIEMPGRKLAKMGPKRPVAKAAGA
jgi:peptidoglycan/LPS O-acetylase OafA/YrhL